MMTHQLERGTKIGKYLLEEPLGTGASGEVWKANDGKRSVAIKLMNLDLMTSAQAQKHRERMEREIHALQELKHPNIPELYDYDLDAPRPYLVMRYVGGESFEALRRSGEMFRLSLARRIELIDQIGQALQAAHEAGIIHRDVKPANMKGTDTAYLLDFSVSLPEAQRDVTKMDVGTPLYMETGVAPDKLGDVYGFALVSYEMIFKQHPIFPDRSKLRGASAEYVSQLAMDALNGNSWTRPSRQLPENIPTELINRPLDPLDRVFARAIGERKTRYTQVQEFVDDLQAAVGIEPPQAVAVSQPVQDHIPTNPDGRDDVTAEPVAVISNDRGDVIQLGVLIAVGVVLLILTALRVVWLLGI